MRTPSKYRHSRIDHNLTSTWEVVPIIIDIVKPQSVVDVGCGVGTFLKVFKELGVREILGVDGKWADKELLFENISSSEFQEVDLEHLQFEQINRTFDLAVCSKVAEHISDASADRLVSNLTRLSRNILFSSAIPGQGGQNHINEQWIVYWQEKFAKQGYYFYDLIRPKIWDNGRVQWWYKQNLFFVTPKENAVVSAMATPIFTGQNMIHPELFMLKAT